MFGIGATELVIILVLALIIFGPGKLPEVGKAIGKGIREFKKATNSAVDDDEDKPAVKADRPAVAKDDAASS